MANGTWRIDDGVDPGTRGPTAEHLDSVVQGDCPQDTGIPGKIPLRDRGHDAAGIGNRDGEPHAVVDADSRGRPVARSRLAEAPATAARRTLPRGCRQPRSSGSAEDRSCTPERACSVDRAPRNDPGGRGDRMPSSAKPAAPAFSCGTGATAPVRSGPPRSGTAISIVKSAGEDRSRLTSIRARPIGEEGPRLRLENAQSHPSAGGAKWT